MKDYVNLGPTPANAPCAQTTDADYGVKAYEECARWVDQLSRLYKAAHGVDCPAKIRSKRFEHDLGTYYEVVAEFDTDNEAACDAAVWLENNAPENWDQ